ncbi:MAG: HEAT repeat domain-containing protein [Chloroflexota bacterium]|nr:HEAT repeat domain-containing protein [Chloroflexota bacterium]
MSLFDRARDWVTTLLPVGSLRKIDSTERDTLVELLEHGRPADRWLAAEALGNGDPGAIGAAALSKALADPDPMLSWEAGQALVRINSLIAYRMLMEALKGDNVAAQSTAAAVAGTMGPMPELKQALLAALDSPHAAVRQGAAASLVVQPNPDAFPVLLRALWSDPDPLAREAMARALGGFGDPAAYNALAARARDQGENPLVRQTAATALGRLAQPNMSGTPATD